MTTARALRGPFDYRLPEELRGGGVDVGSMLVVPVRPAQGARRRRRPRRPQRGRRARSCSRRCARSSSASRRELVALAEWIAARVLLDARARARRSCCRRAPRAGSSGRRRRAVARRPRTRRSARARRGRRELDRRPARGARAAARRARGRARRERRLLHGVTGSGKTEVYLRAAGAALERGRGAIVLVPEIALTPQIVARFIDRFGDTVAVLHSQLRRASATPSGGACARAGARLRRAALGRVRADRRPRADRRRRGARRLLQARGRPALRRPRGRRRARARARRGAAARQRHAAPRERAAAARARACRAASTGGRCRRSRCSTCAARRAACTPLTAQALAEVRAARGKAIVLLNRRGWSNFLSCRSCGRVWSCPHCDVALVLHRARRLRRLPPLRPPRAACPRAADGAARSSVARHGAGTERLQHELPSVLDDGDFPVFRLDADTRRRERRRRDACCALRGGRVGVLIGTQMVAKGHDFPDVTLGVVLDADATLRFPDFRAEERTFALIAQLAGRVGRGRATAACSCRRSRRERARSSHAAATTARVPRGRAAAPRGARATRRSRT